MSKVFVFFFLFFLGYHLLHTFFVFGLGWGDSFIISVGKDIFRLSCVLLFLLIHRRILLLQMHRGRKLSFLFFCFAALVGVIVTLKNEIGVLSALVGAKYDLYPLVVALGSLLLGVVYRSRKKQQVHISYVQRIDFFGRGLLRILSLGLARQVAKLLIPDFFFSFGYGPVGDFILGGHPPLYYRTGPGGLMRLSGLFSGPNNYGYFLVVFFSFFVVRVQRSSFAQWKKSLFFSVYALSLFWTLSRGAWIGVAVQACFLIRYFGGGRLDRKRRRPRIGGIGFVGVVLLLFVSVYKSGSTWGHLLARQQGRYVFVAQPRGYGLGSSGPSVHFAGVYLPENQYLQILIDIGLVGFVFWLAALVALFCPFLDQRKPILHSREWQIAALLANGFFGLLVEGMFLHTLEDSMVNYLFFLALGIVFGYAIVYSGNQPIHSHA